MASYRELPSGNINVQIRSAGKPTKSATFPTLSEAKAWAKSVEVEHSHQCKNEALPHTLWSIGKMYCDRQLAGKRSRHLMRQRYQRMKKSFPQPFLSITRTDIHDYKIKRLCQVSGSTVREEIQSIHKLFNWAEREMIFGESAIVSPAKNIALPPPSKPNERIITQDEFEKLLSELNPQMKEIVEIAWETAMRRSEIINLKVRHLDLDARTLTVENGKTGDRIVPLTSRAIEILCGASNRCLSEETRLYPIAPHSVSTALRRARSRAQLGGHVRMHQLRHTRITALARRGLNQAQIMIVSGHRDVTSLHRYTHLNVKDVIDLLD